MEWLKMQITEQQAFSDLKSVGGQLPWGFESPRWHSKPTSYRDSESLPEKFFPNFFPNLEKWKPRETNGRAGGFP